MSEIARSPRRVSRHLSGYLCGTHSGLLARAGRRLDDAAPESIADAHRALTGDAGSEPSSKLGGHQWTPDDHVISDRLRAALNDPAVIDLILFGSQARGGVTGFSDVDAILVIDDAAADDPQMLRSLRPRILAAQRAVLAYQPMQHHGFEVVTPRLLARASESLGLPAVALAETRSLHATTVTAALWNVVPTEHGPVENLSRELVRIRCWPEHVWKVHRLVAMFELLPTLYLQRRGRFVPKWQSFEEAQSDFPRSWWPYNVLNEVRLSWPRERHRPLELAAVAARNPWAPVAAWRRLPGPLPESLRPLLTARVLDGLRTLAHAMAEQRS